MIATIKNSRGSVAGYRLLDTKSKQVKDVPEYNIQTISE